MTTNQGNKLSKSNRTITVMKSHGSYAHFQKTESNTLQHTQCCLIMQILRGKLPPSIFLDLQINLQNHKIVQLHCKSTKLKSNSMLYCAKTQTEKNVSTPIIDLAGNN